MRIAKVLKRTAIAVCITLFLFVVWIALRWDAPPLRLTRTGTGIMVDVQTWGEYPTTVTRIRLSDVDQSTVVWELVTAEGIPQIHRFMLNPGENRSLLQSRPGIYRVLVPSNSDLFTLEKGHRYRVELWGGGSVLAKRSTIFQFGS